MHLINPQRVLLGKRFKQETSQCRQIVQLPRLAGSTDTQERRPEPLMHEGLFARDQFDHQHMGTCRKLVGHRIDLLPSRVSPPRTAYRLSCNETRYTRQVEVREEHETI